jgi:hypothetical protein
LARPTIATIGNFFAIKPSITDEKLDEALISCYNYSKQGDNVMAEAFEQLLSVVNTEYLREMKAPLSGEEKIAYQERSHKLGNRFLSLVEDSKSFGLARTRYYKPVDMDTQAIKGMETTVLAFPFKDRPDSSNCKYGLEFRAVDKAAHWFGWVTASQVGSFTAYETSFYLAKRSFVHFGDRRFRLTQVNVIELAEFEPLFDDVAERQAKLTQPQTPAL